jgi:hypothetical protein
MLAMKQKRLHRIVLKYPGGLSHSVFIRAHTREQAERRALRQNPKSTGIDRSPYPQS